MGPALSLVDVVDHFGDGVAEADGRGGFRDRQTFLMDESDEFSSLVVGHGDIFLCHFW